MRKVINLFKEKVEEFTVRRRIIDLHIIMIYPLSFHKPSKGLLTNFLSARVDYYADLFSVKDFQRRQEQ